MATVTLQAPGSVFRVTLRSARARSRFDDTGARAELLHRLGIEVANADCHLLAWAAMPAVVQLGLIGSRAEVRGVAGRVAASFTQWVRRRSQLGALTWSEEGDVPAARGADVVAMIHNAPVRAGLCNAAWDSDRTSHQAYVRLAPRPEYLSVRRGLALFGFADTAAGLRSFDEAVLLRCRPREPTGNPILDHSPKEQTRSLRRPASETARAADDVVTEVRRHSRQGSVGPSATRTVAFAAAALGVAPDALRGPSRSGLVRLGQAAAAWCWVRRLARAPAPLATALHLAAHVVDADVARLTRCSSDVARRLGDALAGELTRGDRPRPSVGVPTLRRTDAWPRHRAPSVDSDYTDVVATHPPTARSDILTAQ